jgi:hypothetical protein
MWSACRVWCRALRAMERAGSTGEEHEALHVRALAAGMQSAEDYMEVGPAHHAASPALSKRHSATSSCRARTALDQSCSVCTTCSYVQLGWLALAGLCVWYSSNE